ACSTVRPLPPRSSRAMVWTPSAYTSFTATPGAPSPSAEPFQTASSARTSSGLELSRALRNLCTSGCSATTPPLVRFGAGAAPTISQLGVGSGVEHRHHTRLLEQSEHV